MRICMVTSVPLPPKEGIGFYIYNLAQYLLKKGNSIDIVTHGNLRQFSRIQLNGLTIWKAPFIPIYPFHVYFHGFFVNRLIRSIEDRLDLVHVHTPLSPPIRTKIPIVTTIHTARRAASRSVSVIDPLSLANWLQVPISARIERNLLKSSNLVTTTSNGVAAELSEYGIECSQVHVLGNGVDQELFTPIKTKRLSFPYILYVGRLHPRKGVLDLVKCAQIIEKNNHELKFVIVGDGPLETKLKKMITDCDLVTKFDLLGHIDNQKRHKLVSLYQNATIFVLPSYYEGLPTSMLEAMSCGIPVVTTTVNGALDVICPGKNGLLVPPGQPELMARAILNLLEQKEMREELGREARQTIEKRYSWNILSDLFIDCYQKAINQVTLR